MAFLKFVASIVLGGGLGYTLLKITTPNDYSVVKGFPALPEKYSIFIPSYKQAEKFMNQEKANVSNVSNFKDFETQTGVNNIKK